MSDRVAHAPGHHVSLEPMECHEEVDQARQLLRARNPDAAIALLEPLSQGECEDHLLFEVLGVAYAHKGNLTASIGAFETAVHLCPNQPQTHYNLGQAYLAGGQIEDGRRSLQSALRVDPTYGKARDALAKLPPATTGPPPPPMAVGPLGE